MFDTRRSICKEAYGMKRLPIFLVGFFIIFSNIFAAAPVAVNHTLWDKILKANVDGEGYVDYAGIRINKGGDLYEYITLLETVDVKSLPEEERLAFWINAYNTHAIRVILANTKMQKVDENLSMFDEKFKIAKLNLSLNQIEHQVLRSNP